MTKPKLHLDADVSRKALLEALIRRGHDVTRTPQADLPDNADDDYYDFQTDRPFGPNALRNYY